VPGFASGGLAPASVKFSEAERLAQAESAVRDFCRWHVAPVLQDDVDVQGSGSRHHVLPTRRIVGVSDVTLDGSALTEGVHFVVDPAGILVRSDGGRWAGRLRLTMSHGYAEPPLAVQAVIADMAKLANYTGASTLQAGPFAATLGAASAAVQAGVVGLSGEQARALVPYRLEPAV
jgi:hypothetical protein